MPEEVKPDPKQAPTQDAQLAAENMASGEEKAPAVDIEGDYEASKQFDVSDVDRSTSGAAAAEKATAPNFQVSQPKEQAAAAPATGDPADYTDMAKDIPSGTETTTVTDDLVKEALEKGQPGK